jgi:hypothetical protein
MATEGSSSLESFETQLWLVGSSRAHASNSNLFDERKK